MFQMLVTKLSLHMYPRCVSGCRSFPVFPVDSASYLVATVTICSHKMLTVSVHKFINASFWIFLLCWKFFTLQTVSLRLLGRPNYPNLNAVLTKNYVGDKRKKVDKR